MASCYICSGLFNKLDCLSAPPCGHVCHSHCLSSWVGDSGSCPQCRRPLRKEDLIVLLFSFDKNDKQNIDSSVQKRVEALRNELIEMKKEDREQTEKIKHLREMAIQRKQEVDSLMQKVSVLETQLKEANAKNQVVQMLLQKKEDQFRKIGS